MKREFSEERPDFAGTTEANKGKYHGSPLDCYSVACILSLGEPESPRVKRGLLKSETQGYSLGVASCGEKGVVRCRNLSPIKANPL